MIRVSLLIVAFRTSISVCTFHFLDLSVSEKCLLKYPSVAAKLSCFFQLYHFGFICFKAVLFVENSLGGNSLSEKPTPVLLDVS